MAVTKKDEKRVVDKVFGSLGVLAALVLLVIGVLCWNAGANIVSTVNNELKGQQIYFPPAGNPAFSPALYPAAQKYAGQQVDNGTTAKAYANDYLTQQINLIGGGKTLFELSTQLAADPQNVPLQQLQGTIFQLQTNKTLLLTSGYGDWSQGTIVRDIGEVAVVAAAALLLIAAAQLTQYKKLRR